MSAPSTVDLILLRAAANGEFTYDVSTTYGYVWNGRAADYDCCADLDSLMGDGYLSVHKSAGQTLVEVTALGEAELR